MCPYSYYRTVRNCRDKKQYRYQMVIYACKEGIKPTARVFNTWPNTVRYWLKRFEKYGYQGLEDESRRPHHSPRETPEDEKNRIAELKDKYKRLGAEQIKIIEEIEISAKTIRKIWKEKGKGTRKRRRKHETKRNLREVKRKLAFMEFVCEDTKELKDIPEYLPYINKKGTPSIQYTFRGVTTGMLFMGFADEKSLVYSTLFAEYIQEQFNRLGVDLSRTTRQTDNGSEYIGAWNAKEMSSYTKMVESIQGQKHNTIPPRHYRYQADVETLHDIIEREFYEIEKFEGGKDFINKVYTYQLFFNLERPNTYKEGKTPWELAKQKEPNLNKDVAMIPPVDLTLLLKQKLGLINQGVLDVSSGPFFINR